MCNADSSNADSPTAWTHLRWSAYSLLIVAALATMTGRILSVRAATGESAALSANDRSRWATIRSLVDHQSYTIDAALQERILTPDKKRRARPWRTIDMVKHRGPDGREHYYSSKPTLLPTLLAGEYWLLKQVIGSNLLKQPFYFMRIILVVSNVLPFGLYLFLLARYVERHGKSDWGRLLVVATAAFGTFLTTYAVTLNNHLPAAISVFIALFCVIPIWRDQTRDWHLFAIAGIASGFVVANELPGLSFFCAISVALLWKAPLRTCVAYVPASLVVLAGILSTNYVAHQSLRPPYMHRADGPLLTSVPQADLNLDALASAPQPLSATLRNAITTAGLPLSQETTVSLSPEPDRLVLFDPQSEQRYAVRMTDSLDIYAWDHWYEYEWTDEHSGRTYISYWTEGEKQGIDRGESSRLAYALNVTVGHHGIFSLTPIWLLSIVGVVIYLRDKQQQMRGFAVLVILLTVVVLAFYIARPLKDRNYGGMTSGLRWMFWLIPMWLLCLLPAADLVSRWRAGRITATALLALSIASAAYSAMNPWVHPWIYEYWAYIRWLTP